MNRLYRSRTERKVSGICGGLGVYLGIDPTVIRLVVLFLIIISGVLPGLIGYLIAIWIIPEEPSQTS